MNTQSTIRQCVELLNQRDTETVKLLLNPIIKNDPENFHALQLLGLAYHLTGEIQTAIDLLEKALNINPDFSAVQHNTAGVYRTLGQMEKAEACYRNAIRLKPDYAEAYQGLSEIIRFTSDDPLIKTIYTQLARKPGDNLARYFHFTLGKIFDDCGNYDLAFQHYDQANRLSNTSWSIPHYENAQSAIKHIYSIAYFQQRTIRGNEYSALVFVVGMPRSVRTLIEQILASHSQVFAAGEIPDIQNIADQLAGLIGSEKNYPYCCPELTEEALKGLGQAYLQRVQKIEGAFPDASRHVDKNLYNFNHLGLIAELFPNAHIIHVLRHPLDCCLSSYFQNFSNGVHWSFDLDSIIHFYKGYRAMMEHWHANLPVKILDVRYEELITDTESVSRKMTDFCGLNWEQGCLDFYNTKRTVKTASVWQVRQPIYQRSKARWQAYEKHIGQLTTELAGYIQDYETGKSSEQ